MTVRALLAALLAVFAGPAFAQDAGWSPALERKCTASDAVACWNLGESYTAGKGVAANPAKALAAFSRACDLGLGEACFVAGSRQEKAGDTAGAAASFKKGCESGLGEACQLAAVRTEKGLGTAADTALATLYYERACTLRQARSCHYLSQSWASGEAMASRVDVRRAYGFAVNGCTAGGADSCVLAGWIANGNLGYPRDAQAADRYAQLGCNFEHHGGCMNLGYQASQRKDWTTARRWYHRACSIKPDPAACKAVRDIDSYLADKAQYDAEWDRWNRTQAAGKAEVDRFLAAGDYAGAINQASYVMGSQEQVSRVLTAAQSAGRIGDIGDIYFTSFETWRELTPQAANLVRTEKRRRDLAARQASRLQSSSSGSSWSWTPSSSSSSSSSSYSPSTAAALPRISESEIYRNARENARTSYCNAGWGCR
ncbi:MAG: hypothetical protein V4574_17995 [Pseudomonadota bacterium]